MLDTLGSKLIVSPSRLFGEVSVSGAKNSALKLLAASLLTSEPIVIENYPKVILDAQIHVEMLHELGKTCTVNDDNITILELAPLKTSLNWHGRSIRNTLLILGALVARFGFGTVPVPGGCNIGNSKTGRAYDLHVMLLEQMGARVWEEEGMLCAETSGRLAGADIYLPIRSTGATENAIIAGTLANGITRLWNPHIRPEILDLIDFLKAMGAEIHVYGQEHIEIRGKEGLRGTRHKTIPDNVEALTWLIAASITGGEIEIKNFPFKHLELPLIFLRESGVRYFSGENSIVVRKGSCYPLEISTGPYPGINSDMQPLLAVFGARAKGTSTFIDLRFPGRYAFAKELEKMGVEFCVDGNMLRINGGRDLQGAEVCALDLRAGAALALAGLVANEETTILDAWQISRGYEYFVEKLNNMNGKAQWVD